MNPDQFKRLDALYDAAAALGPAERSRFIDESCADDEEVRRELLAALGADGRSGLTGLVERAAAAAAGVDAAWAGRRIGPYRIVRPIGQGGMGTVYLAVRDDAEFHKQVAIKTLKFELDSGPAVASPPSAVTIFCLQEVMLPSVQLLPLDLATTGYALAVHDVEM